jgi:hypothetical protein
MLQVISVGFVITISLHAVHIFIPVNINVPVKDAVINFQLHPVIVAHAAFVQKFQETVTVAIVHCA